MMFLVNIFIFEKNITDIIIQDVMPDSPAQLAGLKSGDKIVSINNKNIHNISDLQNEVSQNLGKNSNWEIVSGIPNIFQKPGEDTKYFYNNESSKKYNIEARWDPPSYIVGVDISLSKARNINYYSGTFTMFEVSNDFSEKSISLNEANKTFTELVNIKNILNIQNIEINQPTPAYPAKYQDLYKFQIYIRGKTPHLILQNIKLKQNCVVEVDPI